MDAMKQQNNLIKLFTIIHLPRLLMYKQLKFFDHESFATILNSTLLGGKDSTRPWEYKIT